MIPNLFLYYMHVADFKIQFWTNIMPYSGSVSPYFMQISKKPLQSCAILFKVYICMLWILTILAQF